MTIRLPLALVAAAALASSADGASLYAIHRNASAVDSLHELDPDTGESQLVAGLPDRLWGDIAGRPEEATVVYAVARIPGGDYLNQVSAIDVASGAVTDLYAFTASDLGFSRRYALELSGISIAPSLPSVATITGVGFDPMGTATVILFELDLETGAVSDPVTLSNSEFLNDLTFAPDETLFSQSVAAGAPAALATVDPASGWVDEIGSSPVHSIEFHPDTGELYGAGGGGLFIVSPATANIVEFVGDTNLDGGSVRGLAFVELPEPGVGVGLALGAGLLALLRRRVRAF